MVERDYDRAIGAYMLLFVLTCRAADCWGSDDIIVCGETGTGVTTPRISAVRTDANTKKPREIAGGITVRDKTGYIYLMLSGIHTCRLL